MLKVDKICGKKVVKNLMGNGHFLGGKAARLILEIITPV